MRSPTYAPLALFVALFVACQAEPVTPAPPPYRPNTSVAEACEHLRTLGCREGQPTPKGATCETVYADVNASGLARFNADCVVVQASCKDALACR